MIRPKNVRLGRAHGLPKIHKCFPDLSKFRSVIDTANLTIM